MSGTRKWAWGEYIVVYYIVEDEVDRYGYVTVVGVWWCWMVLRNGWFLVWGQRVDGQICEERASEIA